MKFPDQFRDKSNDQYHTSDGAPFGMFQIPGRHANGRALRIIACDGEGTNWEHVSVSIPGMPTKCPSWEEMCIVKALFWDATECVVQFHPPESDYINNHSGCLHLWRHVDGHALPPSILVGIQSLNQ
jgi:hypothetical protein